jgi:predicted CXXCH cytochrome family protein
MYVKKSLMLWLVVFALALPLLLVGTASAIYIDDGALPSNDTNNWIIRDKGVCYLGIAADGTVTYGSETSRSDCIAHLFSDVTNSTQAGCISFTNAESSSHYWASACIKADGTAVSLNGLDRTAANCVLKGGAGATMKSSCVGAWVYEGTGTNGSNDGYCSTTVDLSSVYTTTTACLNNASNTPGYSTPSGIACAYSPATTGFLTADVKAKDTVAVTATKGSYVDLTAETAGTCQAKGFTWNSISSNVNDSTNSNTYRTAHVVTLVTGTATATLNPVLSGRRGGCLECHNSISQNNSYAERWKDSYLKTGHKNMLRKVTAGTSWAGPDAGGVLTTYTDAASGQSLDFANGQATGTYGTKTLMYLFGDWMAAAPDGLDTVVWNNGAKYNGGSGYSCAACHATGFQNIGATGAIAGVCSQSSKATQSACTTAGGTWYPSIGTQSTTTFNYNSLRPGADWASDPTVTVNANGTINGITGKWDRNGIQCARCHYAVYNDQIASLPAQSTYNNNPTAPNLGSHNYTPTNTSNQNVNNLCYGCHQSMPKTSINGGTGNGPDVDLAIGSTNPAVTVTASTADFSGHPIGQEFLNSPHARYTGSVIPNSVGKYDLFNNLAANYSSAFKGMICRSSVSAGGGSVLATVWKDGALAEISSLADCQLANATSAGTPTTATGVWQAENVGACTTCHDVHNSLFVAGQEEKAMKKSCEACHTSGSDKNATQAPTVAVGTNVAHPSGNGTPLDNTEPCVVCHMPKASAGGFPLHLWRINADPNYSTFPTFTEFTTSGTDTKKLANTAPDGTYTNAIWVDLGISCGQCHGASGSAHLMSKAGIAPYAQAMHDGGSVPTTTCATCHATSQNGKAAIVGIGAGKNHHGQYRSCETCHSSAAYGSRPGSLATTTNGATSMTDNAFCATCHNATGHTVFIQGTTHHNGTCVTCHTPNDAVGAGGVTGPGVIPVVVNCSASACHPVKSMAALNHATGFAGTPASCEDCHSVAGLTYPGVLPTTTTGLCDRCHAVTQTVTDRFANIHAAPVRPNFTWTNDATTPFKINLDASSSLGCTSYTWDLGGGTGSTSGVTTSATYTSTTAANVTLTCYGVSVYKTVNPRGLALPLLQPQGTAVATGYSVLFTDTTTTAGTGNGSVRVQWGDGTASVISRNTSTTHLYKMARTYSIRMIITDTGALGIPKQTVGKTITVTIAKMNITGVVTHPTGSNVPLQGAIVSLKVGTKTLKKAVTKADGSYTLLNVVPYAALPATVRALDTQYTVVPYKKLNTTVYTWSTPNANPDAGATGVDFNANE